jgi:hypothetical protein
MAKKPPKKKPIKKKPTAKKPPRKAVEVMDNRPPYKGVKVDFKTQRFCPVCGKLFDITRNKCAFCDSNVAEINPIGDKDQTLRVLALSALKHSDPKTRKEAVDGLGDFEELQVLGVLTHVLLNDPDENVRKEAADEIGDIHHQFSIEALTKAMKDPSAEVRKEVLEGLTKIRTAIEKEKRPIVEVDFGKQRFCPKCGKIFGIERKRCAFCNADMSRMKAIGDSDKILRELAISALNDPDPKVRKEAVDDLGDFEELQILGVLTHVVLNDPDKKVRKEAADEIGDIHHQYSKDVLTRVKNKDKSPEVRKEAVEGLAKIYSAIQKRTAPFKEKPKAPVKRAVLPTKRPGKKGDIRGSITFGEKLREKNIWFFKDKLRKPKINFPKITRRRMSMPVPSKSVGLIIIFIVLFILQTGVVYLVYKTPPALGANSAGDAMFLYPSIHDSFIIEGIVASILIFLSSMGYIMLYQASKYVYNRKMAIRILAFGVVLIFISYVMLQYMIAVKTGNISQFGLLD